MCAVLKISHVLKKDRILLTHFQDMFLSRSYSTNSSLKNIKKRRIPAATLDGENFKGSEEDTWIGPPHHLSNLRLKIFPQSEKLTDAEKHYYLKSQETQEWNQRYWEDHNKEFLESKKLFVEKVTRERNLPEDETLSTQEMSQFYKQFLDSNHKKHIEYNWNWYKKNIHLILLAAKANFSKFKRILKN